MLGKDKIYLISEVGINHNSDMQIAKRLIDATFACGWDCVKFQKRNPEKCVPESQRNVPKDTPWGRMTYLEYKKRMEFSETQYDYIDEYCREKPIAWTASVWDMDSLDFILKYDVPFIKIPSAMLSSVNLVKAIADTGKTIIMSTGMSTIEEIDDSVSLLDAYAPNNYVLMHTNSTYPTPIQDLNLLAINTLKERYGCTIGYSGHEYGLEPSVIAVALGARVIERHVTLDHNMWGTDQAASLEVHAMDLLRKRITEATVCLGDGVKRVTEDEMKIRNKLRGDK
jgi:N-acetylneuraminate synthase